MLSRASNRGRYPLVECPHCQGPIDVNPHLAHGDVAIRALKWIADPSYAGNYDAQVTVEMYRKWAVNALGGVGEQLEPSDYSEPGL